MTPSNVACVLRTRLVLYELPSHQKKAIEIAIATQVVKMVSEWTDPRTGRFQVGCAPISSCTTVSIPETAGSCSLSDGSAVRDRVECERREESGEIQPDSREVPELHRHCYR
jgi:hypothetical protein